jgi:hypothetical protein
VRVYARISSCWLLRPENTQDLQKVRKTANRQEEKYQKEGDAGIIKELKGKFRSGGTACA